MVDVIDVMYEVDQVEIDDSIWYPQTREKNFVNIKEVLNYQIDTNNSESTSNLITLILI